MRAAVSDAAWVQAMLDVEAALARAEAKVGVIPEDVAEEIASHCRVGEFDVEQIGRDAVDSANPVVPLVKALRASVSNDAAPHVHQGATSQDILDTAMMLIARRAIDVMLEDLDEAAPSAAALADRHRATVMAGRTLLQQASVTTLGLKAAGWLMAIMEARDALIGTRDFFLALQFGGPVGTLAALSERGLKVVPEMAAELNLVKPPLPWHTNRTRVARLASAVAIAAGVAGKIGLDAVLLAQTEVGEARERPVPGRGGSSAVPHKANPVAAVEILAAVRGANAQAGVLLGTMLQEHERAAGAWQAEWHAVSELFRLAGGATSRLARLLAFLEVDAERMRKNLEVSGGLIMSEQVMIALAERTDMATARNLVEAAVSKAAESRRPFREVLQADAAITTHLNSDELARALEPSNAIGASSSLIDRALGHYRANREYKGGE
jgi:3-carboxy-cis,cis-muconate cycloisomerase